MENAINQFGAQGLALVGNPGAGKSTILNGIAEDSIFESGISLGSGLTSVLQRHDIEVGNQTLSLFDTPGLADTEKRIQAGKEIDKLLSSNLAVKLAFVITLERGRVKPDDATTVKLVLQAIKSVDVKDKFGVIINQVTSGVMKKLNDNPEEAAKVRSAITDMYPTSHWIYVPRLTELEDATNEQLMTEDLQKFFVGLPVTKPFDAEVEEIDTRSMEKVIEEQRKRIDELQKTSETQRQELLQQLEKQTKEAATREKEIKERLEELERARNEAEEEKYKYKKLTANLGNMVKVAGGTAASILLANPIPFTAALAMCKSVPRPNRNRRISNQ